MISHTPAILLRIALVGFAGPALGLALTVMGVPAAAKTVPVFSLSVSPELPLTGGSISVTVIPENFTASSTAFAWSRDGAPLASASGINRPVLTFRADPERQEIIQVAVEVNPGPTFDNASQSTTIYTVPSPTLQQETINAVASAFTLQASAVNPNPGERVELEVVSFAFDREAADYRWYVDGAFDRAASGRGRSRAEVTGPPEGESRTVRVDVTTPIGGTNSESVTLRALSVPLYWWADTAVPYWYRGKALPVKNSDVTVMALPAAPNPGTLSYRWQSNGSVLPKASGVGRQTFSFTIDLAVPEEIGVTVRDFAATLEKTSRIEVVPQRPQVGIYEARPLRGVVYETMLQQFITPSGEPYDFVAAPFFFPRAASLTYRWVLNGSEIPGVPPDPWKFILTSKPNAPALDSLSVTVEDSARRDVDASTSFAVQLR